jgi:hypothetical protein
MAPDAPNDGKISQGALEVTVFAAVLDIAAAAGEFFMTAEVVYWVTRRGKRTLQAATWLTNPENRPASKDE